MRGKGILYRIYNDIIYIIYKTLSQKSTNSGTSNLCLEPKYASTNNWSWSFVSIGYPYLVKDYFINNTVYNYE